MQKIIAATEARNKLGQLLNRVYRQEEHLVVEKLGIPVAAIISIQDYEEFRRLLALQQLPELGSNVGTDAQRQGLAEDKLQAELAETGKTGFQGPYGEERKRLSRPLTKQQRDKALSKLQAAKDLKSRTVERRGGKHFSDSTELIRQMREEQTHNL